MTGLANQRKFQRPEFLRNQVEQAAYERWLNRKAASHARRDRKRNPGRVVSVAEYKSAIHRAVMDCRGRDAYTGEMLDWKLIGKYNNEESKAYRGAYKAKLAFLPTVDHTYERADAADFAICGWRTNDAKGDLNIDDFIMLCGSVIRHHARRSEA